MGQSGIGKGVSYDGESRPTRWKPWLLSYKGVERLKENVCGSLYCMGYKPVVPKVQQMKTASQKVRDIGGVISI